MRKGYSYRDIIEGRFDVKVRYDELLMPEFFGGFTRDIDMHAISQSVDQNLAKGAETYAGALGSQSGIAGVRGDSDQTIESWWFFLFLTLAFFIVAANIVYPNFIAPMFNKFEDLDDTELKATLTQLAQKSGFTLENIYKIDAGKRDTRLNAYFAGIGKTKKVALYDTLLQKLPKSQICAVIGHELGHFRLLHL